MGLIRTFKQIYANILDKNSPKRKLVLDHAHTFMDGTKLWTYKAEDFENICYRHYDAISELQTYLQQFGTTPEEWRIGLNEMRKLVMDALKPKGDREKALVEIAKYCDHFEATTKGMKQNYALLNDYLLCMFFVLDEESEMGWDKAMNQKKLDLFAKEPDVKAFFLLKLKPIIDSLQPTSLEDIHNLIVDLEAQKDMLTLTKFVQK